MGINVKGENSKLWIAEHKRQDGGHWNTYSVSVSKKNKDNSYTATYVKVKFTKELEASLPPMLKNGELFNFAGFMTCEAYTDKMGVDIKVPVIMIQEAVFPEAAYDATIDENLTIPPDLTDTYAVVDEELPF